MTKKEMEKIIIDKENELYKKYNEFKERDLKVSTILSEYTEVLRTEWHTVFELKKELGLTYYGFKN